LNFFRDSGLSFSGKDEEERKQFAGKLGEDMLKKFLENNFPTKIELD